MEENTVYLRPLFLNNRELKESLIKEENIRSVLDLSRSADAILTSVGSIVYKSWSNYLSVKTLEALAAKGAVGHIGGHFYDVYGHELETTPVRAHDWDLPGRYPALSGGGVRRLRGEQGRGCAGRPAGRTAQHACPRRAVCEADTGNSRMIDEEEKTMATDVKKMIRLVQERTAYGVPEKAPGVCTMQDEDGKPMIRLGFDAHRDCIAVIGYEAAPEVSVDICAALAALCGLALNRPVMAASSLTAEDLAAELSDDGKVDEENRMALDAAIAMFREGGPDVC